MSMEIPVAPPRGTEPLTRAASGPTRPRLVHRKPFAAPLLMRKDLSAARAHSQESEKGNVLPPTIWPVSCPLPAMRRPSSGPSIARAWAIAKALSPISSTLSKPFVPRMMALRIAAGSSERGLSSVTMTRSARRAATSPMSGRFPASRSPPQPNTTMRLPRTKGRSALSALSSASGLCA